MKIEIVDRQYANSPTKRILNATESESGWTFADPIITDASFTIGGTKDTLLKYVFNPESDFQNPGMGGGGGGSEAAAFVCSRCKITINTIPESTQIGNSADEETYKNSVALGVDNAHTVKVSEDWPSGNLEDIPE